MDNQFLINVSNISFSFDGNPDHKVLENISFASGVDEFVSIVGPSGCGKSTMLRIIAGLIKPLSGKVLYKGTEIKHPIKDVAFVFQDFALMPWLNVLDNVKLGLSYSDLSDSDKTNRALDLLTKFGLSGFSGAYPNILSGGMKQRVGIARAIASEPRVLLMDEPFSALDELTANSLRSDILFMLHNKDISVNSVIMVTHNVEEAVELSSHIVILSEKPTKIKEIKEIDMKYPRNKHDKRFSGYVDDIYNTLISQY